MSKFGMFSKKNAQKIGLGLLVLSLLLAAAPRARASFDVTGVSPSSIMKYEDDILYIELGKDSDVIIRNESNTNDTTRKGIVISLDAGTDENSPAKLTLQNLTVSSDAEGAAFLLGGASEGCAITIEIKDAVTLSGDSAGLLASYDLHNRANDLHLVLSADQGAEFKAIGGGNGLSADARYAVTLQGEGSFDFTGSGSGNGAIFVPAFYFQESGGLQGHRREFTLKGNVAVRAAGLEGASGIKAARLSMKENAKLYARGGDSDDDAGGSGIDVENLEMQGSAAIESARGGNGGSSGGDGIKVTGTLTSQQEVLNFDGTEIRDAKGGDGSAPGNGICFAPKHPLKFYFQLFGFIDAQAGNALEEGIGAHAFAFRYGADESDICEIRSADVQVAVPDGTLPGSYMLSVILPSANSLILPNDDETSAAFLKFMNTATNLEGKGTVWFPVLSDVNVKAAAYRYSATQELLASTDCLPDGGISIPVSGSDSFLNMDISFDSKVLNGESYKYTYIVKLGGAGSTFITPTSDADGIRYFIELSADAGIEIDSEINPGAEILISDSETAASPQVTALKKRGSNAPAADDNARYGLLGLLVPKEASSALDKDGANFGVRIRASGSDISGIISSMLCGTLRLWGEPGEPQNGEGGGGGGGWQPSPTPPVPPSDLPLPPDTPSGPAGVSVTTEDGTTLEAQKQPDGTYLIVVPGGSEPGSVTVRIELPDGEVRAWEWDFSEGPFVITVPIDGVEQEIRIEAEREPEPLPPDAEALQLVDPDPEKWLLNARWEKDGSYSAAVAAPFVLDAEKPGGPSKLLVKLEGLSNVGWSVVWVEGYNKEKDVTYAKDKMLWMGGTAEDEDALKNLLSVSQIEFRHGDAMHLQTFDPPVTFESILEGNRYMYNEPPAPVVVEKGGGCDAGFGAGAAMLAVLAACLAARKGATSKAR